MQDDISVGYKYFTFFTIFLYILKALGKLFLFPPQLGKLIVREENFTFFTIFLYILKALGKLFLFPPQLGKLIVREENMDRELYLKMV